MLRPPLEHWNDALACEVLEERLDAIAAQLHMYGEPAAQMRLESGRNSCVLESFEGTSHGSGAVAGISRRKEPEVVRSLGHHDIERAIRPGGQPYSHGLGSSTCQNSSQRLMFVARSDPAALIPWYWQFCSLPKHRDRCLPA